MKKLIIAAAVAVFPGMISTAHASGIPTVDVAALAQNIVDMANQIQQLEQALTQVEQGVMQIEEARNQVLEAQRAFDSLNGIRGLGSLLNSDLYNASRNYLPNDWRRTLELGGDISNGRYSSLAGIRNGIRDASRLYDRSELFLPTDHPAVKQLDAQEKIAVDALAETEISADVGEARINDLVAFKNQVNTLPDQKSVLDLQATMTAEGLLMQNELIQVMNRKAAVDAQQLVVEAQKRERTLHLNHLPYDPSAANEAARTARTARWGAE